MRRIPVVATLLVTLAVAGMIALGLWQLLDRLPQKRAYLDQLAANPARPPIPFPAGTDDTLLFRRTRAVCLHPTAPRLAGAGAAGFRAIVDCAPVRGATVVTVQLGTTRDPVYRGRWSGGAVSGYIAHAPDSRSLISGLWDHRPRRLMLVAARPPAGLAANAVPDLSTVPNNHLAYAGQWFFFAAIAAIIYGLALRRRLAERG